MQPITNHNCEDENYEIIDIFNVGNLTDTHIDCDLSEEELAQRLNAAVNNTIKMGGKLGASMQEDLGVLMAPKMTWQDFAIINLGSKKEGIGKNDWGHPRSRALFYGQYLPKKKTNIFTVLLLIDRSGSVLKDQATYGVSQIQTLGANITGYVVCFDTVPHYDTMTEINSGEADELNKIQFSGGGGTMLASSLYSYEEKIEPVDMVIIITDGAIFDMEEINKRGIPNSNTEYLWLLTERNLNFNPSFGRTFRLNNET